MNKKESEIIEWLHYREERGFAGVNSVDALDAGFDEKTFNKVMDKLLKAGKIKELKKE
jgi:hypothetical protein